MSLRSAPTAATVAPYAGSCDASSSAARLVPEPDTRTTRRALSRTPRVGSGRMWVIRNTWGRAPTIPLHIAGLCHAARVSADTAAPLARPPALLYRYLAAAVLAVVIAAMHL